MVIVLILGLGLERPFACFRIGKPVHNLVAAQLLLEAVGFWKHFVVLVLY
jgi:hypothetical protein